MNIDDSLDRLIQKEGGYSNDPKDAGGETMYGITIAVARAFGYIGDMRNMTRNNAREIYLVRYWQQPRFNDVAKINNAIAEELFDTGVNMGVAVAGKFLQRALNVLNREGKTYPDIGVDGLIGNVTLAALKSFIAARGTDGLVVMLRMLNAQQSVRYIEIAERRPANEEFEYGWQFNRVAM